MKRGRTLVPLLAILASAAMIAGCASSRYASADLDGPIACAGRIAQCACGIFAPSFGGHSDCGPHPEAFPAGTNALFLPSRNGCR